MGWEIVTTSDCKLQTAPYCGECVLYVLDLDFADQLPFSLCFKLTVILNQSEVTWPQVNQVNNLGLMRVMGDK